MLAVLCLGREIDLVEPLHGLSHEEFDPLGLQHVQEKARMLGAAAVVGRIVLVVVGCVKSGRCVS